MNKNLTAAAEAKSYPENTVQSYTRDVSGTHSFCTGRDTSSFIYLCFILPSLNRNVNVLFPNIVFLFVCQFVHVSFIESKKS